MMFYEVRVIDEDWKQALPSSQGPYDPATKCRVSLQSQRGRWLVTEGSGNNVIAHCYNIKLKRPRGILVSHSKGNDKVALEVRGRRFLTNGSRWKWLWNCRRGIRTVSECNESELFTVNVLSNGLCTFESAENTYLTAVSDYQLGWEKGQDTMGPDGPTGDSQRFTVIVHKDETEDSATS